MRRSSNLCSNSVNTSSKLYLWETRTYIYFLFKTIFLPTLFIFLVRFICFFHLFLFLKEKRVCSFETKKRRALLNRGMNETVSPLNESASPWATANPKGDAETWELAHDTNPKIISNISNAKRSSISASRWIKLVKLKDLTNKSCKACCSLG